MRVGIPHRSRRIIKTGMGRVKETRASPRAIIRLTNMRMDRNFWRDLYPISETRRRFARYSFRRIYLPVGAGVLVAAGIAAAVLAAAPGEDFSQTAQLATIAMAFALLGAGFVAWLFILGSLWGLNGILEILPVVSARMRLRFIIGARSYRKTINAIKHIAAAVFRALSPRKARRAEGAQRTAGDRPPGRRRG
jgi:hypothetical protein